MKNSAFIIAVIFCIIIIGTIGFADNTTNTGCVHMEISTNDVYFEGNKICFSDDLGEQLPIYTYNGLTYVPLRAFAQEVGKVVEWDENLNKISINNKQTASVGKSFGSYVYGGDTLPRVSMIQLLANPEKYNGQNVNVQGFILVEFELDRLFLTREDLAYINEANSLSLNIRTRNNLNTSIEDLEKISGSFVEMEGTFVCDEGYMSLYDVTYICCKRIFSKDCVPDLYPLLQ